MSNNESYTNRDITGIQLFTRIPQKCVGQSRGRDKSFWNCIAETAGGDITWGVAQR